MKERGIKVNLDDKDIANLEEVLAELYSNAQASDLIDCINIDFSIETIAHLIARARKKKCEECGEEFKNGVIEMSQEKLSGKTFSKLVKSKEEINIKTPGWYGYVLKNEVNTEEE